MATKHSISIIVPCLNEEENLAGTIECVNAALASSGRFSDHEILIFNDCSTDSTGSIAEALKKRDPNIRVVHNERNMGFGYNYTEGVRIATKEYIMMVPGDNEMPVATIKSIFALAGRADVVIPYYVNMHVRPSGRRAISRLFVSGMNALFSLDLRYFNGTCLIRSELLKKVPLKTWGFAYMAAILVRLLRSGSSYVEVGVEIIQRTKGKTKAFTLRNIVSVFSSIWDLFWEVRVAKRKQYALPAREVREADAGCDGFPLSR